ncbi:MAG: DUF2283 domain-containing protein [Acidobacteriota bacterium]|nr:DUF2283 domain-containing protein [Blastocatellia bacterium]MDW8241435.1 DUF2283 domain-containing protein [Acidobacteriota bacterium]
MEKKLTFSYYPPSDELNIHFGEPRPAISREIDDEIYLRLDPETREVVGLTVLHFRQRFAGAKSKPLSFALPVLAHIKLSKRETKALGIS